DGDQLIERAPREQPRRLRQIDPRIPRDLETIVLKAIAAEPASRYQTGEELAEDLRRFLGNRPIRARRSSIAENLWRWCRRNPVAAALSALLLLALLTGVAGITWQWLRAEANLEVARQQQQRADDNARTAHQAFEEAFTRVSE